jgi:hypothetical protein
MKLGLRQGGIVAGVIFAAAFFEVAGRAGELPPAIPMSVQKPAEALPLRSWSLPPTRIVWKSEAGVKHAERLLQPGQGQTLLKEATPPCVLTASSNQVAGVLLDFGVEVQGYLEIFTPLSKNGPPAPVRVRFGESVSEAMAEIGEKNAQNDHAVRDQNDVVPWCGKKIVGPSGFRFVRIDATDPKLPVSITEVRAVLQLRDVPYLGSFKCDDARLNRIWEVGAYTVHLNMQEYLWDGIKRDRLVWLGDMHPEVSTINAVFGFNDVVPRSLDLIRGITPPTEWMNGISSYSMWWVIIQEDQWMHHGNRAYLEAQKDYLAKLLRHLGSFVGEDGRETLNGMRFLDWPTYENKTAVHEGLQAMLVMTLESGARVMDTLGEGGTATFCRERAEKLRGHQPETSGRKSPAALLALAGVRTPKAVADGVLKKNGPADLSTFYGYYVLQALAKSGDADAAIDFISTYWGAMLDYGATTFWEDFDLAWTNNAARIDELPAAGKKDIHGDYGAHCYVGFRHSLCHGWASGPTAWLSQHVLGVQPIEPGMKRVRIVPQLGRLKWAEGSYPTPLGVIKVRHERQADGGIKSEINAPQGIVVDRASLK